MPFSSPLKTGTKLAYSRVAAGCFIAIVFIAAIAGYQVYQRLEEEETQQVHDILNRASDQRTAVISDWIKERSSESIFFSKGRLAETASRWIEQGAPQNAIKAELREQLNALRNSHNYVVAGFIDENGYRYASSQGMQEPPDKIELDTIRQALDKGGISVSSIRMDPSSRERVLDIVAPLIGTNGKMLSRSAVLWLRASIERNPDPFLEIPPRLRSSPQVLLTEIRNHRVIATASNNPLFKYGAALSLTPDQLIAAGQDGHSSILWKSDNENTWISMIKKIDGTPWYTVTVMDQKIVWENIRRTAWIVAAACASILSALGIGVIETTISRKGHCSTLWKESD